MLPLQALATGDSSPGPGVGFQTCPIDTDFSRYANFSDAKMSEFASDPFTIDVPLINPTRYDDWIPKDARFNDGALITVAPGRYRRWGQ